MPKRLYRLALTAAIGYSLGVIHTGEMIGNPVEAGACWVMGITAFSIVVALIVLEFVLRKRNKQVSAARLSS